MNYRNRIICGHTLEVTKQLPSETFDTIVTSPPYWGLRDYGVEGQIGLEPTLDLYLSHLWQITDELYRVLKKTGVMFWNHGDCYNSTKCGLTDQKKIDYLERPEGDGLYNRKIKRYGRTQKTVVNQIPLKCMVMQNYRLILGMIDIDYRILVEWRVLGRPENKLEDMLKHPRIQQILRNNIIWDKPNHMPSSVKDRFANAYEPVFMLTKNNKPQYYYNTKTGLMADKQPKKLIEGIDWDWKIVGEDYSQSDTKIPEEEAEKLNSPRARVYRGKKYKKVSYWKSVSYWFDLDAMRQPHAESSIDRLFRGSSEDNKYSGEGYGGKQPSHTMSKPRKRIPREIRPGAKEKLYHQQSIIPSGGYYTKTSNILTNLQKSILTGAGKNPGDIKEMTFEEWMIYNVEIWNAFKQKKKDVWKIPTQSFKEAHFATFPEKLIQPMILSACPQWICKKCGKARVRITKPSEQYRKKLGEGWNEHKEDLTQGNIRKKGHVRTTAEYQTIGWSDCGCNAGWRPGITLDPFIGSGTTALVAKKLSRSYCGIELNPSYKAMTDKRLMAVPDNLPFE